MRPIVLLALVSSLAMDSAVAQQPVKYVRYSHAGRVAYGILEGDRVQELSGDLFSSPRPTGTNPRETSMTTTRRTAIAALFCIVLPAAAAARQETRPVGEFTQIGVSAPVEVEVSIGDTHTLTLEGDAEAIARIETVVESGRLKIRTRPNERKWEWNRKVTARVVTEEKHIYPNVDLFSGAGYAAMGIPTDQFTPIFAMSRVAGWAAHVLEQHGNNRLIRPRAEYTGPTRATYVPIAQR